MADPLREGELDTPLLLLVVVRAFTLLRSWPGGLQVILKLVCIPAGGREVVTTLVPLIPVVLLLQYWALLEPHSSPSCTGT